MTTLTVQTNGAAAVTGDQLNTYEQTCNVVAQLRAFIGVSDMQVYVRGTTAIGDGGQGPFYWNASGTHADDNGATTIVPTGSTSGQWTRLGLGNNTGTFTGTFIGNLTGNASNVSGVVAVTNGGTGASTAAGARTNLGLQSQGVLQNLLPNTQWQIFSLLGAITKPNYQGTGSQNQLAVTGYPTGGNTTTLTCADTGQLKVGDIVRFTTAETNLEVAPMRVSAVVVNTSFTVSLPFGLLATGLDTPVTTYAVPITAGDNGIAGTGAGPDGWSKTTTLAIWRDDFTVNQQPGSVYSLGMRKGSVSLEALSFAASSDFLPQLQGRTVVFGAWVYQKVQGGAGTWTLTINDSGSVTTSTAGTGAAVGGYQWIEVSATISTTSTYLIFALYTNGTTNDIYYLSQPMLAFGSFLGSGNYTQNPGEVLRYAGHVNAPTFVPFSRSFPSSAYPGTGGVLFGWNLDMEALTFTQISRTVKTVLTQFENTGPSTNILIATADSLPATPSFGPAQRTQTSNVTVDVTGEIPLTSSGYWALYTGTSGATLGSITLDMIASRLN